VSGFGPAIRRSLGGFINAEIVDPGFAEGHPLREGSQAPAVKRIPRSILFAFLLPLPRVMAAQGSEAQPLPSLESLLNEGQRWWDQNIDEEALPPLPELDLQQVEPLLRQVQDRLQAENLLDVAELRRVADALLPWLERETALRPYVPWLRARLDYFKAAEILARPLPRSGTVPTPEAPPLPLRPQKPTSPEKPLPSLNPIAVPSQPAPGPLQRAPTEAQQRKVWSDITIVESWPTEARRRVPQLKPIFREEGVPEELVWVAEVESSFDPGARSPAGAAGLYQLMPETARAQGLSTFPFDQRYRPEKNARASARYLRALHRRFKDWPLALAAYNAGETRVANLLNRHRAKTFSDIARYLPAETQMYVPRIDALLQRREGRSLARLPGPTR
jgi:membrane-bound lytic murein transglycosylase D